MRYQGRITTWTDAKGYGFVTPNGGGEPVFLHVCDFVERARRPEEGDLVTYEVIEDDRKKPKAVAVAFVQLPLHPFRQRSQPARGKGGIGVALLGVAALAAAYGIYSERSSLIPIVADSRAPRSFAAESDDDARFKCAGKTQCTQMRSCEEATFYLKHCTDVQIDGDHDGIPCERQWCN